jgi:hypothetical protein
MSDIWRHKKSGRMYAKLSECADCTDSKPTHGTVVVYCYTGSTVPLFVREKIEFEQRFEPVTPETVTHARE